MLELANTKPTQTKNLLVAKNMMISRSIVISLGFLLSASGVMGFSTTAPQETRSSKLSATSQDDGETRRDFFSKTAGMAVLGMGFPFLPVDTANAVSGVGKVNAKLKG